MKKGGGGEGWRGGAGMTEGGREGGESVGMKKDAGVTEGGGVEERQRRGVGDRGAAWLVCRLAASHPPPNLPLEGGRDELGRGWQARLA